MAQLIKNPLRQGLPSKMYLLAFPEVITGYAMAKTIQGIKDPLPHEIRRKHTPQTAKIYENIKKWDKLFGKNKSGCLSKSEPLIGEIERRLKEYDIDLSELEKYILKKVLNSNLFRYIVGLSVKETDFEYDIDASSEILRILGDLCFWTTIEKNPDKVHFEKKEEFDNLWEDYKAIEKDEQVGIEMRKILEKHIPLFHEKHIDEGLKIVLGEKDMPTDEEIINNVVEGKKYLRLNLIPFSLKEKLVHLTPNFEMMEVIRGYEDAFNKGIEIRKWQEKYQKEK